MTFALAIEDHMTSFGSRIEAREALEQHISGQVAPVFEPANRGSGPLHLVDIDEFYRQRDEDLRPTWGHDPAAQAQWVK